MTKQVEIGKTGLQVNPVGFGSNAIGGHNLYPDLDENQNKELVKYVIEKGVNLIDTAFGYGEGRSEELIGEVLQETGKREKLVIATKASQDGEEMNNSPEFLKKAVNDALERLQTDYIDLFYIHFPDETTPKDQAVAALNELKQEGKIKAVGVSNFSFEQLKEANKNGGVDVLQGYYNLLHREAEDEFFSYLREHDISFVPFFPFQSGLLTGKYQGDETFSEDDLRSGQDDFKGEQFQKAIEKVEKLRPLAEEKDVDIANIVLAFYLEQDVIDIVIPGSKREDQVDNNQKTLNVELSDSQIQFIDELFAK